MTLDEEQTMEGLDLLTTTVDDLVVAGFAGTWDGCGTAVGEQPGGSGSHRESRPEQFDPRTPSHETTTAMILAEQPFLRRLALRLAQRDADADDLVQETLLRAYNARDRFRNGTSMRAWTATILRRLFLTSALKEKRRGTRTDTDAGEPLFAAVGGDPRQAPCSYAAFDQVLDHVDDRVRTAFGRLSETYRAPFLLFALDGLTYAEIAARLRVPPGTVMSRIHRARRRLQAALEDHAPAKGTAHRHLRGAARRETRSRRPVGDGHAAERRADDRLAV